MVLLSPDKTPSVVRPTLLDMIPEAVIPAKAGIQIENNGFRVKPGMTIKVKGLLTQYTRNQGVTKMVNPFFIEMGIQKFKV